MSIALLVIGVLLIVLNGKAIKKEKGSFTETLHIAENEMNEFHLEIGKLKMEFAETLLEIQKEIEALKQSSEEENEEMSLDLEGENFTVTEGEKEKEKEESPKGKKQHNNMIKINEIQKLLKEGASVDLIANQLQIGKGEVLLIKDLYLK